MRAGHAHGYRTVEFDVKLAADNIPGETQLGSLW